LVAGIHGPDESFFFAATTLRAYFATLAAELSRSSLFFRGHGHAKSLALPLPLGS
jgi:hypothetical protein